MAAGAEFLLIKRRWPLFFIFIARETKTRLARKEEFPGGATAQAAGGAAVRPQSRSGTEARAAPSSPPSSGTAPGGAGADAGAGAGAAAPAAFFRCETSPLCASSGGSAKRTPCARGGGCAAGAGAAAAAAGAGAGTAAAAAAADVPEPPSPSPTRLLSALLLALLALAPGSVCPSGAAAASSGDSSRNTCTPSADSTKAWPSSPTSAGQGGVGA